MKKLVTLGIVWAAVCAAVGGCSAPPDIAGVAQNTPYSHSVNAVFYLDSPRPWTTGAVPGTPPPTVSPQSDFRRLFHKSELIDRLGHEQGAIRELMALAEQQNQEPPLTNTRLSRLREALKTPKQPIFAGVPASTLENLGIAAATMDSIVQFALALTVPDPTLSEINDAYSRELVAHNDPLAIIVNGVRLPSDGEWRRDIAVVLQIESSTEIGRKDIVVSYQRDVVPGDALNFADQLVYFDPAWDAVNPVEFRIQLLDVSAERNERTQQLLTQADGLMARSSHAPLGRDYSPPVVLAIRLAAVHAVQPRGAGNLRQRRANLLLQGCRLLELLVQRRHQVREPILERLVGIIILRRADIAAGREGVVVLADLLQRGRLAEAGDLVGRALALELAVDRRNLLDFFRRQLLLFPRAGDERAQLAAIDEQDLVLAGAEAATTAAVLRQEPQAARDLRVGEELARELHDAVHVAEVH